MTTAEWQARMETAIEKHEVALFGDYDRPGLTARLATVEAKILAEKNNRLWLIGILVAILGDIIVQLVS